MKLKRTTGIIAVQLWQEIHDHFLNEENKYIPITELQRQWKLIRDSFVRKAKQLKELHTKKSGYSASAVKRILSWPFFERLDFLVVHEDLGIRISNVDNDGYAKVTYLEDRPARPQNPPNFCEVPQPETSRKRKSGDAFEVIHEIAEDLKKQDVRGDEWDAIYYWLNYILNVLEFSFEGSGGASSGESPTIQGSGRYSVAGY
ncbi:hypothetical protein ANCCAN_13740 [Ancylostoma caninum]|uniref:MADF domain-containing protein n=1 Tax=Ancylostoma caninum TaxID=29170 RepID=A0A368G7A6_ANCCA|nr:hypothetical protein ANCCAN_13740 [Ancylostoma caninum]